jgi:hypothetical protein
MTIVGRNRPHRAHGSAIIAALVFAGAMSATVALPGISEAGASLRPHVVQTFTWSGLGSTPSWSDTGNWVGGVAPTAGATVNLVFPELACSSVPCGYASFNDLTGLTVANLQLTNGNSVGTQSYDLTGKSITVDSLSLSTPATTPPQQGVFAKFDLPIVLGVNQTWSITSAAYADPQFGSITGAKSLKVSMGAPGSFVQFNSAVNVGALTFQGVVANHGDNGTVYLATPSSTLNVKSGKLVTLNDVGYFVIQSSMGPTTTVGAAFQLGQGGGTAGTFAQMKFVGNAIFDVKTPISLYSLSVRKGVKPVAGRDYGQIKSTGSVKLNSVPMTFYANCNIPLNTKFTVVTAGRGLSGTLHNVKNGATVEAFSNGSPTCSGKAAAPDLKIAYDAKHGTVTATTVK